jgi:hypothetical protein
MRGITNDYRDSQFPSHNIDPSKKDGEWLLKFCKAAWGDCYGQEIFYHMREKYELWRAYAYGRQPVDQYKPMMGVDQAADTSMWNVTWGVRPVLSKYMDIITSIMMNVGRKATATPIDALAEDKADEYFADIKSKIMLRDAMAQMGQQGLAASPYLMTEEGQPKNMKELEMQYKFGFKFNMAMEAEQGIELVQYQNNLPVKRIQVCKDLVQLGVGGYKDWLDESGKPKFRDCDPGRVIMSNCQKADFSDKLYVGEIIEPSISELSQYFNEEEIKDIEANANYGAVYNNARVSSKNDKLKIAVLDLEILTWNDLVYSRMINEDGNEVYKVRPYENITNPERVKEPSNIYDLKTRSYKSKYFSKKVECWYKIKWVIGTNYYYEDGKVEDQKRAKGSKHESQSSYHFYAVNFSNMTAQGIVERLKDIADEYQLTIYKIQDFKNKWLPYIMEIDLDALESVAMGKGGTVWTPEKIMDLVFQTRALVVRKKDISGINVNYKAMEVHQTGMATELVPLMNDLSRLLQEMNDVTGLNPVTDSTGSGERKLKATALLDQQATNNALTPLMFAEKMLFESLSKGCILRLIQAVKRGQVSGVMSALGAGTVKFIKVSPDISLYDWGIKIQDIPTDDDIKTILEQMGIGESQGLFRPQDIFIIKSLDNLKAMEQMIGYLYEERYKEQQAYEQQKIQLANQGNQQTVMVSEDEKRKTLQTEYGLKAQLEQLIWEKEKDLLTTKMQYEARNTDVREAARVESNHVQADAKVHAAHVASETDVHKSHVQAESSLVKQSIANEGLITKQKVANEKPVSITKK